ncbi:hypothetical protein JXQ31_05710 [candidate division KSB1 bacterium]|nr:hypothetical protein [candidate division KSB1 bacterium]
MTKVIKKGNDMNDNLYTAMQKKYMKAQNINELNSILADYSLGITISLMNQLDIYKNLKEPNFFDSTFGNKKLTKEYQTCAGLMARLIAVLFNSFRHILYGGLTKDTTENVLKNLTQYIGDKLPGVTKFKIKDKQDFTRFIYKQVVKHNFMRTGDSFSKDLEFLKDADPDIFTQGEILKIQQFSTDGWIKLYLHTYITQYKKISHS